MGIVEYLKEKRKSGQSWKRDNIELLRPVVNIFLGEFQESEIAILKETLEERIGVTQKVFFCQICLRKSESDVEDGIYRFVFSDVDSVEPYEVSAWDTLCQTAEQSAGLKKDVLDFVNNVFNAVSTVSYMSKGRIRLNYILKMDSVDVAVLPTITKVFNACFTEYFSNGVYADAYCLLDQKGYNCEEYGEERKALNYRNLTELDTLTKEKLIKLTYIISNYTSQNYLEVDYINDQMQTIALNMIIKDGKTAGSEANAYSNDSFMQETGTYAGNFCSLGKLKLEVNNEIRSSVVYKTVFDDLCQSEFSDKLVDGLIKSMNIDKNDLEMKINELFVNRGFAEQMFYPMIINKQINNMDFISAKREELIENIYGRNLEFFWDLNYGVDLEKRNQLIENIVKRINQILADAYKNNECSLAEISQAITRAEDIFKKNVQEYECNYSDMRKSFDEWLERTSEIGNIKDKVKETDIIRAVYILACQYMEKRTAIVNSENYYYVCKGCLQGIKDSAVYYKNQADTIAKASVELKELIADMEQDNVPLVAGNMNTYYSRITKEYLQESAEYKEFKRDINNKICSRELVSDGIFDAIVQFCEENILNSEHYPDDISVEMLKRLKNYNNMTTDEAIYDLAFETIMNNKKYYANHTEFGQVYQAVCFLVNPRNEFVRCTNERMNTLLINQQMKIFYENHYNGMDVLYLEGCFDVEVLYQYNLYRKAWEELTQK